MGAVIDSRDWDMPCCPLNCEDHYPYEKLTRKRTADIQRLRDQHVRKLRREKEAIEAELNTARKQLAAVRAAGIDPEVLIASQHLFEEQNNGKR